MNRQILVALSLLGFQGIVSAQEWGVGADGSVGLPVDPPSNSSESPVSADSAGTSTKLMVVDRVAHVARARERRSPKGQGLLRKEGPPTYAILSRNLVLSRFSHFLKGFYRAFNKSHPAFKELSTKAILLS